MSPPKRTPFVPETTDVFGPGVDHWRRPEENNDKRTDHDALMADKDRRRRIANLITEVVATASDDEPDRSESSAQ